jgi:hypothetical protein
VTECKHAASLLALVTINFVSALAKAFSAAWPGADFGSALTSISCGESGMRYVDSAQGSRQRHRSVAMTLERFEIGNTIMSVAGLMHIDDRLHFY